MTVNLGFFRLFFYSPFFGGVGETRTLAPGISRPTPLAGAPRHQLEYYSEFDKHFENNIKFYKLNIRCSSAFVPSCGAQNFLRLGATKNFDRYAILYSLHPTPSAFV